MRILRIIASADPTHGGPIQGVRQVGIALARLGHIQDVVTLDQPDAPFLAEFPGTVIALGEPIRQGGGIAGRLKELARKRVSYSAQAIRWIKENSTAYDVVVVSGLWNYATLSARWGLRRSETPFVVFTHGMLDPWFNKTYRLKGMAKQLSWLINEGPLLASADRVLFTSKEEQLRAEGSFKPYKVAGHVVAYGAPDADDNDTGEGIHAFRSQLPRLGSRSFILFLSRIHEKKGCDLLVQAFAELAHLRPDLDLVIAGPDHSGLTTPLKHMASQHGVSDRIHWPGMLTGQEKAGAFRSAYMFALPSHQENFGIAVAEALAYGLPVLITDKVNIWREVADGKAGLVTSDNIDGVRAAMSFAMQSSQQSRDELSDNARVCFARNFRIDSAAKSLEKVLHDAIKRRSDKVSKS